MLKHKPSFQPDLTLTSWQELLILKTNPDLLEWSSELLKVISGQPIPISYNPTKMMTEKFMNKEKMLVETHRKKPSSFVFIKEETKKPLKENLTELLILSEPINSPYQLSPMNMLKDNKKLKVNSMKLWPLLT